MSEMDFSVECRRCPRLAGYLDEVADRFPDYHARPVAPFGDDGARLLIVGLAPGMHGANATGRPFTGDHAGILLYQTLFDLGLASRPDATAVDDGLELYGCRITNAVKCLPPENKPTGSEINTCNDYLATELRRLPDSAVVLALGTIAHRAVLKASENKLSAFPFGHGAEHRLEGFHLVDSYHCSRYNTQTRRLTQVMFLTVLDRAKTLAGLDPGMTTKTDKPVFDAQPFLARLTGKPGIYRMLGTDDEVLYVGKARNLKRRVSSYFQGRAKSAKTLRMLREVRGIDVTVTATETEALLLEYNLIKKFRPYFNVLLRDDKSFPYIYLSTDHAFPRLSFYRGARKGAGKYFGPYPSTHAVRETLSYLQKLFLLRPCENTYFANRSRPCLQYQIKRCSAPCVGLIEQKEYANDVGDALLFLEGKSNLVIDGLVSRMDVSSAAKDYEKAAHYRDQIASLKKVQERQFVSGRGGDFDVVSLASAKDTFCVSVMFVRSGRSLGSKSYFPKTAPGSANEEVMSAFLAQYYLAREAPDEVLISTRVDDADLLAETLGKRAGRKVALKHRVRGQRARWLEMTRTNAEHALGQKLAGNATTMAQLEAVQQELGLSEPPQRLECFDISHTQGEATVASCVVFNHEGAVKSDYRRFNITGLAPGDDYAAMRQVMTRRYLRVKKGEAPIPDLVIVDGGKGQLSAARKVMQELQLADIPLLAVAKGAGRRAGREKLFLSGHRQPFILAASSPALHLVQQIRDEAHRFAISGHRQRRARSRKVSVLEAIPGLGPKRRRELLRQFGGLQGVKEARTGDLARVKGISRNLAEKIYLVFHADQ